MILTDKKISVIAPVFNESEVIEEFYHRMKKVLEDLAPAYEIIFIDDGSLDNTLDKIKFLRSKNANIKIISFSRNFGHAAAISAGLEYAAGDAALVIDADLQDPPEMLREFIKK